MKKNVRLSKRLKCVADLVTPGTRVCDVGCDHGFLPIYLVSAGICPSCIAMDVREGPLQRCREHVAEYGLGEFIDCRLCDGLEALCEGEADCVVCAGMGGRLMEKILREGEEKIAHMRELILQPQSQVPEFRSFLCGRGYRIIDEDMVEEEGIFYPMMKVAAPERFTDSDPASLDSLSDVGYSDEDMFGGILLERRHPVLFRFLEYRKGVLEGIMEHLEDHDAAAKRRSEIEAEYEAVCRAISLYEMERF